MCVQDCKQLHKKNNGLLLDTKAKLETNSDSKELEEITLREILLIYRHFIFLRRFFFFFIRSSLEVSTISCLPLVFVLQVFDFDKFQLSKKQMRDVLCQNLSTEDPIENSVFGFYYHVFVTKSKLNGIIEKFI